jgi:hypothetical protein
LAEGQGVFVIVDGGNDPDDAGSFTLTVSQCTPKCDGKVCGSNGCGGSCGKCAALENCSKGQCVVRPGSSCEAPISVYKSPYEHESDHKDWAHFLTNPCVDGEPPQTSDVLYRFVAPEDGDYSVWLEAGFNGAFYLLSECGQSADKCLGTGNEKATAVSLSMVEGAEVFVVVDGKGEHLLHIDETCVPQCDGRQCGDDQCDSVCGICTAPNDICDESSGSCLTPFAVLGNTIENPSKINASNLPVMLQGDTTNAHNHYAFVDGACPHFQGNGGASNDQVWQLEVQSSGDYVFDLWPKGFDAVLYLVSGADINANCVAAWDGEPNDRLSVTLEAGSTVYLVVDGSSNLKNESGPYELYVEGPLE